MPMAIEDSPVTKPKELAHDEAPANVDDHKFDSRGEWWDLCRHCGLARAAHSEAELISDHKFADRDDGRDICGHCSYPRDAHEGVELAYVGDDED